MENKRNSIENWIAKECEFYKTILGDIEKRNKKELEGTLRVQTKNGHYYYYNQKKQLNGNYIQEYLGKNKRNIAKRLATKEYQSKVKKIADINLKALQQFQDNYLKEGIKSAYDELSEGRRRLVEPFRDEVDEIIKQWNMEEYRGKNTYRDGLIYETERGEFVRSKSEVIIANFLHRNKKVLSYKYERGLQLKDGTKVITVYPDFTVLNLRTGKVTYWEHAGKMDDESYVSEFLWKYNRYIENGFERDTVFTYETSIVPLDIKVVKQIIKELTE